MPEPACRYAAASSRLGILDQPDRKYRWSWRWCMTRGARAATMLTVTSQHWDKEINYVSFNTGSKFPIGVPRRMIDQSHCATRLTIGF